MSETTASAISLVRLTATLRTSLLATLTDEELAFAQREVGRLDRLIALT